MATAFVVPHFGRGSNSVDGPASMVDHENAVFGELVNNIIRPALALARSSGSILRLVAESERIGQMETLYDRGLFYRAVIESCKQEFGNDNYFRLALSQVLPREYYLATVLDELLIKKDLPQATDVICPLQSSVIRQIIGIYPSLFGREIEDHIETFTFGEHRETMLNSIRIASALERNDPRAEVLRQEQLEEILSNLNKNVIETFKCPRMAIGNCVFGLREEHMRAVVDGYHKKYGRPLEKDLTIANYGHVEHAFVTKIKCAVNRPGYHAEKLCDAMIDQYTRAMRDIDQIDRETIVRVITTVAEIDMMTMKEEYRQKSGRALEDDISVAFADRQDCLQLILLILNPKLMNDDAVALRAED